MPKPMMMRWLVACLAAATLAGCAALPAPACLPPSQPMLSAELAFGRNIGDRLGVSDAEFKRFTAEEITPRFPDGLTVVDGVGQWRDGERGHVVREKAKLVTLVFAEDSVRRAALSAIAEAYKQRFKQQAVMVSVRPSCVSF
ncbi:uncharacterized protein DUF3574 [Rhodopseudomonas thermotolerans]|uniref:Uncharacterized protein DUF3574 n=2 Tax=Rhodopseudomonas TaxID=1073 RepID=A0A336JHU9_9BRAD|nr:MULTISPECIES: DUF3574 domain-containing protein [Rhodopseudomonas]RED41980.1 uncharacterized protein DUF3574 [Rhodopseudomonas pentothenatexigens]REG07441.1 uncharacterized protein DUF3574 [Rhodopseudomonas thermotolerans]SSW89340.1 uncharacterized protein DUF3574 [Rhodopseudomonas pentothenatexigens]